MKFDISKNQFVLIDRNGNVHFHHRQIETGFTFVLKLMSSQFFNLDDVMRGMKFFSNLTWYPLGKDLWFYKKDECIKLVDIERQRFFRFYETGWKKYKSSVHSLIVSFLHDVPSISHHQSHARDENQPTNSLGRPSSHFRKRKQILSWPTRNGCHANAKWTKSTIISRRQSANPRSNFGRRGGKYARRNHRETEESKEDGELSGYDADDSEFGCEPSVAIEH